MLMSTQFQPPLRTVLSLSTGPPADTKQADGRRIGPPP